MSVEQLIYTDRPRGKGLDPARAGYQIIACSDTLSADARQQLDSISMHYGDAVYGHAPRAAKERETAWRIQAENVSVVPDEVLNEFPVIWSYDRLTGEQLGLTRVRYSGMTHDGRFGNFFAHALVFSPESLDQYGFNPLALSRSSLFLDPKDSTDVTSLAPLQDLGAAEDKEPFYEILRRTPYRDHLAAMISALSVATPEHRPALICLADWRDAAPLVEALLNLLSPTARRRTTFSTYESDRKWLMPTPTGGRPTNIMAAHHLLVLCAENGRPFDLRPDEYQSFAIFNFVDNRFSDAPEELDRYAVFAAACVCDGKLDRLRFHHELVERFGLGLDRSAWNTLVPAVELSDKQPTSESMVEATRSFAAITTQTTHAALELLLPHVRRLAQADDFVILDALATDLAAMVDRVEADTETNQGQVVSEIHNLSADGFIAGRGRTSAAILNASGQARDKILLRLLKTALGQPQASIALSTDAADQAAMISLMLEGLRLADRNQDVAPPIDRLLVETFRAARAAGLVADVWRQVGEKFVKERLDGEWSAEKERLARDLVACVPVEAGPDAHAWLNLKLLETTTPQGNELLSKLKEIARACSLCTDFETLTNEVLRKVQERFSGQSHEQRAEVLGHMAEAADGTSSGAKFFGAYSDEVKHVVVDPFKIRRKLADAGAVRILCREMLAEWLSHPGNDAALDDRTFNLWATEVLRTRPNVLDAVRQEVASRFRKPGQAETLLPLAERLIPKQQPKQQAKSAGPGLIALYSAVALTLPLEPLSNTWDQLLVPSTDKLDQEAKTRLEILKFMREVKKLASNTNWSTTQFPHQQRAWHNVAQLRPDDHQEALDWCIDTFASTGVTTPQEAEALVQILDATGEKSPEDVAVAASLLIQGRDPVTCVLSMMAFARCVLEGSRQQENYGLVVRGILERCDKRTRGLFEEHLAQRFYRRSQNYDQRMKALYNTVGLSGSTSFAQSAKAGSSARPAAKSVTAAKRAQAGSVERPGGTGILDRAKLSWRKLLGSADDESPKPPKR